MAHRERLGPADLRQLMLRYRDALVAHKEVLNRLNVYPVPDGDTGKNMAHTVESVVAELDSAGDDMAAVCHAISHGSLMGASGNSGVILSQVLRGITGVAKEAPDVDGPGLAAALEAATAAAYAAVQKPVEGTILTVLRASAEAATGAAAGNGASLLDVLEPARRAAADALERTPELLPKLAEAGVVDAGGAGYVLLLDAALTVADGRPLPEPPAVPDAASMAGSPTDGGSDELGVPMHDHTDVGDLRYEVMYFLEAPDAAVPAFKEVWSTIGDSIVVVGGDGLWNCHIHTNDIGAAIEAAVDCGRPRKIRVTDLHEQVEEERWVREAAPEAVELVTSEPCATAVVAVCTGVGQQRLFRSLRVQSLVVGGQTMNPSTRALLEAVERTPAEQVIVLPNNKNIIAVAEQLDALTSKEVVVLPTTSVPEGLSALLEYDPEADAHTNLAAMGDCARSVVAAEVTRAVRDSSSPAGPIREGDWIGLTGDGVKAVASSVAEAATGLLAAVLDDGHGLVTLLEGEGSSPADTRTITEWLHEHHPGVEVEVQAGDQPHYPYLFGIE